MRFGPTFRSGRMRPADGPSSGSATLSRIRSLADYTIAMLESSFRKRHRGFLCGPGRCPFRKSYPDGGAAGQDWDGDNDTGPLDPAAFEGSGLSMTHTAEFILHQFLHPSF